MFERFTEPAREVVVLAQDEARTLKHHYIGTEHILLGLLREEEGLAGQALDAVGVTVEEVRARVARIVGQGDEVTTGQLPFTPAAKKVLELALREALSLGQGEIGTEHVLLGLVRETDGVAADILRDFDADADKIRNVVIRLLSAPGRRHVLIEERPRVRHETPAVVVCCPVCMSNIVMVWTDRENASFHTAAEGERACPKCGTRWNVSYTVTLDKHPSQSKGSG
jgi:ATP-dependent Clp protease ATP-binding subunit ClpA